MQKTAFFRILKEFFLKKGKTLQAMCEQCNVMAFSFAGKKIETVIPHLFALLKNLPKSKVLSGIMVLSCNVLCILESGNAVLIYKFSFTFRP